MRMPEQPVPPEAWHLPHWDELAPSVQFTWQERAAEITIPPDTQFSSASRKRLYELSPFEWEARIARDPVLAGRVLAVANSAAFGQVRQVSSLARAVILLGYNLLETILIAYHLEGVIGRWPKFPRAHFEYARNCAAAASVCGFHLARAAELDDPELAGTSALLSRLGALVLGLTWPAPGPEYAGLPDEVERLRYELKRWQAGVCHLSALVARQWGLPENLVDLLADYPRPLIEQGTTASQDRGCIVVCCASVLAAAATAGMPLAEHLALPAYQTLRENLLACSLDCITDQAMSSERVARELLALRG